jgi:hypothetical protein
MAINFDSITNDINSLKEDIFCLMDEFQEIQTNYDELLDCLGATDRNSALDVIRAMKAALGSLAVAAPVVIKPAIKFSDSTALTPAELTAILAQSISKAVESAVTKTEAIANARDTKAGPKTFRDIACLK